MEFILQLEILSRKLQTFDFSLKTAPSKVNDETYTEIQERQAEADSDGEDLDEGDEAELPDHLKNDEKVSCTEIGRFLFELIRSQKITVSFFKKKKYCDLTQRP